MKKIPVFMMVSILVLSFTACSLNDDDSNIPINETTQGEEPFDQTGSSESIEQLGFEGGNIGAGGLVSSGNDGNIYYRSESDGWKLYKAKPNGSEKTKISDRIPSCINVLGDWVYFLDHHDNFSIYKVRTNGTEETKLTDGYYCNNLYVADSGIYFDMRDEKNASHVYCADLDGRNITLLFPNASLMYYYKGRIYLGSAQLGVYDIETGDEKILSQAYAYNISVDDSGIYYWAADEGEFRHMDLDGTNENVILKGGDFFNYSKGNLYYMGISENQNGPCHVINCLNIASNETTVILEEVNEFFNVHGEFMGITFLQYNENPETIDPELFVPNDNGEIFIGYNESVGYVYTLGGYLFMRGSLRESIIQNGKLDCIARLDGSVTIWD